MKCCGSFADLLRFFMILSYTACLILFPTVLPVDSVVNSFLLSLPLVIYLPGLRDNDNYIAICFGLLKEGVKRLAHYTAIICLYVSIQTRLGTLKRNTVFFLCSYLIAPVF